MSSKPVVSCIVITHNRKNLLEKTLNSIINQEYDRDKIEIIVVDDASTDGTHEFLRNFVAMFHDKIKIKVLRNNTPQFAAGSRNIGALFAQGKYLFFIDDDVELTKDCIKELVNFMETHPDFVAATPLILDSRGMIWNAGVIRHYLGINRSYPVYRILRLLKEKREYKYVTVDECITAYIIRREDFEKIRGFRNKYKFYYEESEMFYRLKLVTKKKIASVLTAKVYHHVEGDKLWKISPLKAYLLGRNRIWFYKEWCNSSIHFTLCGFLWIILSNTIYLMNFLKYKNFIAFKYLIRGIKHGLFTSP